MVVFLDYRVKDPPAVSRGKGSVGPLKDGTVPGGSCALSRGPPKLQFPASQTCLDRHHQHLHRGLPLHSSFRTLDIFLKLANMGHLDDNKTAVPEWQKSQSTPATESTPSSTTQDPPATLQQARKFLQDEEVQKYPRDKKIDFLKSKGLSDADIQQLIVEDTDGAQVGISPNTDFGTITHYFF
jgi:hypothetical protein